MHPGRKTPLKLHDSGVGGQARIFGAFARTAANRVYNIHHEWFTKWDENQKKLRARDRRGGEFARYAEMGVFEGVSGMGV